MQFTLAGRFADDEDPDESLHATRDYFWMLQDGILEHTPSEWRSFRHGYHTIEAQMRGDDYNPSITPPPGRIRCQ